MKQPNIIWLVQDHVPWKQTTDSKGPKPYLPNYQRVASEGMQFSRAYTPTPLCSPARGSMLTGVMPHKHGIKNNVTDVALQTKKGTTQTIFTTYLKEAGYQVGYFGKWHAGNNSAKDYNLEGFSLPDYGDPYATDEYQSYLKKYNLPEPIVDLEWSTSGELYQSTNLTEKGIEPDPVKKGIGVNAVGTVRTPAETMEGYFLADMVSEWIKEKASASKPFMARVDLWGPHQPYLVAAPFKNTIDPNLILKYPSFDNDMKDRPFFQQETMKMWRERTGFTKWEEWQPILARAYEHFSQADHSLSKIFDVIDELGLEGNTVIIYTADHGDAVASHQGLFDKDAMMAEETMSIPLAIKWPQVIRKGVTNDQLTTNMDVVPTILEIAGVDIPSYMDGKSLVPLLKQQEGTQWRDGLMAQHFGHLNYQEEQRLIYWREYKYVAHLNDTDELYHLEVDPFENKNLINDDDYNEVLKEIQKKLLNKMEEAKDTNHSFVTYLESLIKNNTT